MSLVFLKLNSKSYTSFAWSKLHHFCLYYLMLFSTKLNSFAHETARIINVLLCLVSTHYFPTLCIQAKDVLPFPFVSHTIYTYFIRQALLKLTMIFFKPFVPPKSSLRQCFLVLDFVSAINYSFHPVFETSCFVFVSPGILLSVSPQRFSLTLPLFLSMLVPRFFQSFLNLSPPPLHALM